MKKHPPNFLNVEPNSPEWLVARTGLATASRMGDVMSKGRGDKESSARASYKLELLTEILTGRATEHYVTAAMQFGIENEPLARTAYELERGVEVERVGLVLHPRIPRSAASPDGLVGKHGLVEFKVPNTTTHLEYLMNGEVPERYKEQMLWQMACAGRKWCDFVSYDPRLPDEFGLFIVRFQRDEKAIAEMESEVEKFIAELDGMAKKLLAHRIERAIQAAPGPPKAEIPAWDAVSGK